MDHNVIDERSRQLHLVICNRLRANPDLLEKAKGTLECWLTMATARTKPALREWRSKLDGDFDALLAFMESKGEPANRLRQSSPFAGETFITRRERLDILKQFNEPRAA